MSLGIQQTAGAAKDGRWDWSVWIDGPDADLDQVDTVEWVLHPTFSVPIVRVNERQSKFRLDSSGWAEFEINAHLTATDGGHQHLKHWLRLADAGDTPAGKPAGKKPAGKKPAIFVSASLADARWEDAVREALGRRGVEVLTANDIPAGMPVDAAISSTLDRADSVIGIFSAKSGAWTEREVNQAIEQGVSVVPLAVGPYASIPDGLSHIQTARISDPADVDGVIGQITQGLV
jgi:hypothetical protein